MASNKKRIVAALAAASMAVALAACGGGTTSSNKKGSTGGTLYYFIFKPYEHTDPQRSYLGVEMGNFTRTVYRGLVAFPISTDPQVANKPVPDLATDTGTASDGAKTWSFTIKDGVKWEDGKDITCADFQYGASRVFARDVLDGGPSYLLSYLDVPSKPDGSSSYSGPYTSKGQAAFDKAITCQGKTITYHFKKAWADFNLAIAALHMMDPYRKDKDQGKKSNYQIFSNGPYKVVDAKWNKNKGATFVRNTNYDPKTDSKEIREANPDKIVFEVGSPTETIYDRLIADAGKDKNAVTQQAAPPAYYSQITGAVADRAVNVKSPFVDYMTPNFKRLKDLKVRQALAMSVDLTSYITALGGDKAASPGKSIVNPAVLGYQDNPAFTAPEGGDPAAAKKLLQDAGVKLPYPIKYTYPSSETYDKASAALKQGWEKAGFKVTLDGLTDTFYDVINKPDSETDVAWAGWGSDWPSAVTVTPPLFDSRINLTKESNGSDYGNYKSDAFNQLVDKAQAATTLDEQTPSLQKADEVLGKDVAYIPLEIVNFYMLRGSNVTGYTNTPPSAMYPDLGPIGVK